MMRWKLQQRLGNLVRHVAAWAGCSESARQPAVRTFQAIGHPAESLCQNPLMSSRHIWTRHTMQPLSASLEQVRPSDAQLQATRACYQASWVGRHRRWVGRMSGRYRRPAAFSRGGLHVHCSCLMSSGCCDALLLPLSGAHGRGHRCRCRIAFEQPAAVSHLYTWSASCRSAAHLNHQSGCPPACQVEQTQLRRKGAPKVGQHLRAMCKRSASNMTSIIVKPDVCGPGDESTARILHPDACAFS